MQCDGEPALVKLVEEIGKQTSLPTRQSPALVKLVEEIGKQTSLPTRQSPAYSHQSQAYVEGWHRRLFAQFRALLFDFCHRYKLQPSDVKIGGSLNQHMLRHAVWLLNRFQLHSSDHKTSFQRRWCLGSDPAYESAKRDHRLQPQRSLAIWLGRCEATGEHILAKANNTSLVKSRTVTRLSLESSMDLGVFKSISIPPPELTSVASLKMAKEGDPPSDQAAGEGKLILLKLTQSLPGRGPEADQVSNNKLSHLLSTHHQDWFSSLYHKLAHKSCNNLCNNLCNNQLCHNQLRNNQLQHRQLCHNKLLNQLPCSNLLQQASQPKPVRRRITQKGPGPAASKLHNILERLGPFKR